MDLVLWNLALFILLFPVGRTVTLRAGRLRVAWAVLAGAATAPAATYALYYLHAFDGWRAFYAFRSHVAANVYPGTLGLACGALAPLLPPRGARILAFLTAVGLVAGPFLKPLAAPLDTRNLRDLRRDGARLQSTPTTCGPAAVASLLALRFGDPAVEPELARAARSTGSGTEVWYLAQALRARGYQVAFRTGLKAPLPGTLAGVDLGGAGHFIAILEVDGLRYRAVDPLRGLSEGPDWRRLRLTGFAMEVRR